MSDEVEEVDEEQDSKSSRFPVILDTHWWALRKKFKGSIPASCDAKYIATALGMGEKSARGNILRGLKALGIVGEGDKTNTALAARWRDDSQYSAVCKELREKCYPQQLRDVAPKPLEEKEAVRRWFGSHGVGENMVSKASRLYFLLWEADPSKANDRPLRENGGGGSGSAPKPQKSAKSQSFARIPSKGVGKELDDGNGQVPPAQPTPPAVKQFAPQLHLNIQIHISPETTPEQIEAIFAAMGKHLKSMAE
jgi:hypothetical protein